MATAISVTGVGELQLTNVVVRGFDIGLDAADVNLARLKDVSFISTVTGVKGRRIGRLDSENVYHSSNESTPLAHAIRRALREYV